MRRYGAFDDLTESGGKGRIEEPGVYVTVRIVVLGTALLGFGMTTLVVRLEVVVCLDGLSSHLFGLGVSRDDLDECGEVETEPFRDLESEDLGCSGPAGGNMEYDALGFGLGVVDRFLSAVVPNNGAEGWLR